MSPHTTLALLTAAYSVLPLVAPGLADAVTGPIAPDYTREQVPALAAYTLWDWTHRVGVAALLVAGLLQLRRRRRSSHRVVGRLYVGLVALACAGGAWMVLTSPFHPSEVAPALTFAGLFAAFTLRGMLRLQLRRDIPGHARDMQRSFALALGPLLVRVVYAPLWAALGIDQREAMGPAFWIGWGLPLLALEAWRRRAP